PAEVRGEADGRALVVDGAGGGDGDARDPQPLRLRLGEHGPDLRGGEVEDGVERVGAAVVTVGPGHRDGGGGADGAAEVAQADSEIVDVQLETEACDVAGVEVDLGAGPAHASAALDLALLDEAAFGEVADEGGHGGLRQAGLLGEGGAGTAAVS